MAAKTVLPSSPEYAHAAELCRLRGYKPDDFVGSVAGLPPVTNAQWIIAEQILEAALRRTLMAKTHQIGAN